MTKRNLIIMFTILSQVLFAQKELPTIKANNVLIDIKVGDVLNKKTWTISPKINLDVYTSSALGKNITFYTDIDSITVKMEKTTKFDFIVLLKDSVKAFTQIKYKKGFLEVLKESNKYNYNEQREIPKFTYQDKNNPNLVALRKGFNLDSIAGTGNEVSKILNLLHWIHKLIPHDGNHNNPQVKNAMSMINTCKIDDRGLNCRGLATVLNECYLSLGFKSRFVTCLPKDPNDTECHVINMVYSNDYKKWIWVDPTHDSYVMDEKGELLGFKEVRDRLINDKTLILNPDANWNYKASTVKEYYLYKYMAKNLYRFQCPLVSEYDSETKKEGKKITYIELLPLDYYKQTPYKTEKTYKKSGVTHINYKTNNPTVFWQSPF